MGGTPRCKYPQNVTLLQGVGCNKIVTSVFRDRVLRGNADASIRFGDLCALLQHLGFAERIRGGHHIFTRDGVAEILNLQARGGKAKAYQVKQVRSVLTSRGLAGALETEESSMEVDSSEGEDSIQTEEGDRG